MPDPNEQSLVQILMHNGIPPQFMDRIRGEIMKSREFRFMREQRALMSRKATDAQERTDKALRELHVVQNRNDRLRIQLLAARIGVAILVVLLVLSVFIDWVG
jgi:hypothetical protein